ncbi:MAG: hypothetical protein JOZ38_10115, partial [Candidatus Eremiobacteraeota bacterium]|nr:hypothetical protein [Candidatus Eremiobacteraeota bacterium]
GLRITYHLRPDARFADGVALTSADVAFTYHAIFDPRNRTASIEPYRRIAALQTPDAHTVVLYLRAPWNAAPYALFAQADYVFGILPKHAFADTKVVGSSWEDAPFGTGPFRVKTWRRGDRIVLEPNPYFRPRPKLSQIVLQIVPNLNANFIALRSGSADVSTLTPETAQQAAHLSGVTVERFAENATGFLYLQTQAEPARDWHVRRAVAFALNRPALENAWRGEFPSAASFLPPPIVRWKSVEIRPYPHDLAAAARELDAAGWRLDHGVRAKNGIPLSGIVGADAENPLQIRIATMLQAQLAAIGMQLSIKTNPTRLWYTPQGLLRNGNATMVSESWIGGGDPEQSINLLCVQARKGDSNHAFYCSKKFDALFADQARTPSISQRQHDFDAMQRLVYHDVPVIPLYYEVDLMGVSRRVTGYRLNMLRIPADAESWDALP